jgi:hypothetical protein
MDPTERLAPYISKILSKRNNLFLTESGSSIFKYNFFNYTYGLGETIARSNNRNIIALEKGRKKEIIFIIEKYFIGEIFLESPRAIRASGVISCAIKTSIRRTV